MSRENKQDFQVGSRSVAVGRAPIIGSPLQQWVDRVLEAKYGSLLHAAPAHGSATSV